MRGTRGSRGRVRAIAAVAASIPALLAAVAAAGDEPPVVTITGDAVVGATLTATAADLYKWQRCDPAAGCTETPARAAASWTTIEGAEASTYMLTPADLGHLVRVRAKVTALGSKFATSNVIGPVVAAPAPVPAEPETPRGPEEPPAPEPVFNQSGNVQPIKGTVLVRLPTGEVLRIEQLTQIPEGSVVDVTAGHAILTTQRRPGGRLQSTEEWGAAFVFDQKRRKALTDLTITDPIGSAAPRLASAGRRGGRGLWGRGRCRCRTNGQNSSGTARGTHYLVKDTARGTLTRVKHGKVLVKEFRTGERILLGRGESHLARGRR